MTRGLETSLKALITQKKDKGKNDGEHTQGSHAPYNQYIAGTTQNQNDRRSKANRSKKVQNDV